MDYPEGGIEKDADQEDCTQSKTRSKYSRRKTVTMLGAGLAFLFGGLNKASLVQGKTVTPGITVEEANQSVTYEGTARTRYEPVGVYGEQLEPTVVTLPAQIFLSQRYSFGGLTESNPFSVTISTGKPEEDPSPITEVGELFLVSALGTYTPETYREILLQYWEYEYNEQSGRLTGELTSDHAEEASAINMFWVEDIRFGLNAIPAFVHEGTTVEGTLTPNSAQLIVEGTAFDAFSVFPFSVGIEADRVQS